MEEIKKMSEHWYMLTLVGKDRPGIVAAITKALFEDGCNLGEASMLRLGDNFTIMLMASCADSSENLGRLLAPVAERLALRLHVDPIEGRLHSHIESDVRITVSGADRPGIVAQVTDALAKAGLNIVGLESDVAGTAQKPIYIMHIEGQALQGIDALRQALASVTGKGIEATLHPIDTLIG
jgi:glycine cleavage system transcriptional repressor